MAIVLTYDLKSTDTNVHTKIKDELTSPAYGYEKELDKNGYSYYELPNTTLIYRYKTPEQAINDIKDLAINAGTKATAYFATYISGEIAGPYHAGKSEETYDSIIEKILAENEKRNKVKGQS